jgi:hypothetical protein
VTVFCLYLIANLFVASHADTAPLIRDRDLVPFLQRAPLLREQLEEVYKTCIDLGLSEASATQIMEEVVKTGTRDSSKRDQALETLQKKPRVYEADLSADKVDQIIKHVTPPTLPSEQLKILNPHADQQLYKDILTHIDSGDDFEFFDKTYDHLSELGIPIELQRAWVDRLSSYRNLYSGNDNGITRLQKIIYKNLSEKPVNELTGYIAAKATLGQQFYLVPQELTKNSLAILDSLSPKDRKKAIEATMNYAAEHAKGLRNKRLDFPDPLFKHYFSKGKELVPEIDQWVVAGLAVPVSTDYRVYTASDMQDFINFNPFGKNSLKSETQKIGVSLNVIDTIPYTSAKTQNQILKNILGNVYQKDRAREILARLNWNHAAEPEFLHSYLSVISEIKDPSGFDAGYTDGLAKVFVEPLNRLSPEMKNKVIDVVLELGAENKFSQAYGKEFLTQLKPNREVAYHWASNLLKTSSNAYISKDLFESLPSPEQERILTDFLKDADLHSKLILNLQFSPKPIQKRFTESVLASLKSDKTLFSKTVLDDFLSFTAKSQLFAGEKLWPQLTQYSNQQIREFALNQCAKAVNNGEAWGKKAILSAISDEHYSLSFRRRLANALKDEDRVPVRTSCMLRILKIVTHHN